MMTPQKEDDNWSTSRDHSLEIKRPRQDSPDAEYTSHISVVKIAPPISVVKIVPPRDKTTPEHQTGVNNEGGTKAVIQNRKSSVTTITSDDEWLPTDMDNLSAISATTRSWVGDSTEGNETGDALMSVRASEQRLAARITSVYKTNVTSSTMLFNTFLFYCEV